MGVIQKQSIKSSIFILMGFALGAINIVLIAPKIISAELFGLTRIITDVGLTMATFCTFGAIPVIYKFFPFYKSFLPPRKNDLAFLTLLVCIIGFTVICILGYCGKGLIIRKYSDKSPLFVEYYYLIYPFCLFMLLYTWLESFSWSLKKAVLSNTLKEIMPRLIFTVLLGLFFAGLINKEVFLWLFSSAYLPPFIILFILLYRTGEFSLHTTVSPVTRRLKGRMVNFGLFLFGSQFLNLLSKTSDSIIIAAKSENGLTDTAVFTIATYIVTLMEVPQRSITSISVPVLSESWRNKDMQNISFIYHRSVSNLLIIGLSMLSILTLNAHNMVAYLGKDYQGIEMVVIVLGLAKLIDLGTGTNSQIIGTSSYWRVDFTTNVVYTLLAIPLNFVLITHYGMIGAAYAAILSQIIYNLMRFIFLWYKFQLQPYRWKHLLTVVLAVLASLVAWLIPKQHNVIIDAFLRTSVFLVLFIPFIFKAQVSEEINNLLIKQWQQLSNKIKGSKK